MREHAKRYDMHLCECCNCCSMIEDTDGDYVLHDDYEALRTRVQVTEAVVAAALAWFEAPGDWDDEAGALMTACAELKEARDDG